MLARFERLMEQAVEGSLRRVFPTPLQPVQLAKADNSVIFSAAFLMGVWTLLCILREKRLVR